MLGKNNYEWKKKATVVTPDINFAQFITGQFIIVRFKRAKVFVLSKSETFAQPTNLCIMDTLHNQGHIFIIK